MDEADHGRDGQMRVREIQERDAADKGEGDIGDDEDRISEPLEGPAEDDEDSQQRKRDDGAQAGIGAFSVVGAKWVHAPAPSRPSHMPMPKTMVPPTITCMTVCTSGLFMK